MYDFVRLADSNCLCCGQQLPPSTIREVDSRDIITYRCYQCQTKIVTGVVGTYGEMLNTTPTDVPRTARDEACMMNSNIDWTTWELWWTDVGSVCAINGRVTCGNEKLYQFVVELQEEHGTKQTA